jgi:osmoprotectant transport system permease protein
VVLISPKRAHDARLIGALKPLIGRIDVAAMRAANLTVDRDHDKATPAEAAKALEAKLGL